MLKIPTIFLRDTENRSLVTKTKNPECDWVFAGEGVATRKYDGTCVMLDSQYRWWARREVKPGKKAPDNYLPLSTDPNTGKTVGWEPIEQSSFARVFAEAMKPGDAGPGTYELCGPKVNGNPENYVWHVVTRHGGSFLSTSLLSTYLRPLAQPKSVSDTGRSFSGIRDFLLDHDIEGLVFHHPDGRMAKIKGRDFGIKRGKN